MGLSIAGGFWGALELLRVVFEGGVRCTWGFRGASGLSCSGVRSIEPVMNLGVFLGVSYGHGLLEVGTVIAILSQSYQSDLSIGVCGRGY
jgi:hypothetical protein